MDDNLDWNLHINDLCTKLSRTKFMSIQGPTVKGSKNISENFELFMGDHKIEKTTNYKYLGLIMDDNLDVFFFRSEIGKLSVKFFGVNLWATLPTHLKEITDAKAFSKAYKKELLKEV